MRNEEHPIYKDRGHSTATGRYIRTKADTYKGTWVLSSNSVDGTIHLNFLGEGFAGLKGLDEQDLVALRKVCDLFLKEDEKHWKRDPSPQPEKEK